MSEPTVPPAPDRPPVPRIRPSWLVRGYALFGAGVLGAYLLAGWFGWDRRESTRDRVPSGIRSSPGGYRSYHYSHRSYQGGK